MRIILVMRLIYLGGLNKIGDEGGKAIGEAFERD